ncbi:hypothetical protein [Marinobacter nauticus]|uniref:hypothetical protein n=1 Tax=Marinobacter nauticus TaxID=2743 RepID=UPI001CD1CFDD|nr:hypothetical protein [Marinobacter nauticus]MCA0912054.1 hypothetical protein [Marinobacter nauticus]
MALAGSLLLAGCDSGEEKGAPDDPSDSSRRAVSGVDISLALEPAQLDWVGQRIFQNECAGRFQCLVHWNEGEAFPSLGIGHFIWYPEGVEGRFVESFPQLIAYMSQRQASVPDWLRGLDPLDAPWQDRAAFMQMQDSVRVAELREFLAGTQGLQAEFIFRRAQQSLGTILDEVPDYRQKVVQGYLEELSATPGGVYALMDYVNFKGEGLAESERYKGEGWGLLQVLLAMDPEPGQSTLDAFRVAAGKVLTRRARNAENPIERERWLPGWLKRLETYREPITDTMATKAS